MSKHTWLPTIDLYLGNPEWEGDSAKIPLDALVAELINYTVAMRCRPVKNRDTFFMEPKSLKGNSMAHKRNELVNRAVLYYIHALVNKYDDTTRSVPRIAQEVASLVEGRQLNLLDLEVPFHLLENIE